MRTPMVADGTHGGWRWRTALVVALAGSLLVGVAALGHLHGGAAAAVDDPLARLGGPADTTGCQTAPLAIGEGTAAYCGDVAEVLVDGTVRVVSLVAAGSTVVDGWTGPLPEGLRWHEPLAEVADALGEPARISPMYGPPTLVYMFRGRAYGSLELVFDTRDELVRVNASLTR